MKNYNRIKLRPVLILGMLIVFIFILLLIAFKASYPYMIGPRILSYEYEEKNGLYNIKGTSTRVKILKIQGREIPINANGAFDTKIIKLEPYTTLIIEARDRFDHSLILKKDI